MSSLYANIPSYAWKDPVSTLSNLPTVGNTTGDARVTQDTANIYVWNGSSWQQVGGGSSLPTPVSVANGGTNSGTALNNGLVMVSAGGQIVESTLQLNNTNPPVIQSQANGAGAAYTLLIESNTGTTGAQGPITIQAANSATAGQAGGALNLNAGNSGSLTTGIGGAVSISGGSSAGTQHGGNISITGGANTGASGTGAGGIINITGGSVSTNNGAGGGVNVSGGAASGGGVGGALNFNAGTANSNTGGNVSFTAGQSTSGAGGQIMFQTGATSSAQAMLITAKQSVVAGSAALTTSSTDGFLYIPLTAGAPTGVPTSQSGYVAMTYDTSDNKLYVYNGAWKSVTLA